jgi:anti-sigma factor RsiW
MGRCVSKKVLSRYVDGDLAEAEADCVRRHVAQCPVCAAGLEKMRAVDKAIRLEAPVGELPDVAGRVTAGLAGRGAFLGARIAAGKRRLFGERIPVGRLAAVVSVAASIVVLTLVGMDYATREQWKRETEPVLADAQRVLVRLVLVDREEQQAAFARARELARDLALSERLAGARAGAKADEAAELDALGRAFALLADGRELAPELVAQLEQGDLLRRAERLREGLALAR